MKKTIILTAITIGLVVASLYAPDVIKANVKVSGAVKLSSAIYTETVIGSGKIENFDEYILTSAVPVIIKDFLVSKGDSVEVGDTVAVIDTDATKTYLLSLSNKSNLSSYSALLTGGGDISALVNAIPQKLYSEKSGVITEIDAQTGQIIMSGTPIAKIANNDTLVATISVNEADASKLSIGQEVSIVCKAVPQLLYSGKIESISETARKNYTGTSVETVVDTTVFLDNTSYLKSGYSVTAQIATSESESVNCIPYEVIMQDDEGEYVYVLQNGKTERRNIVTGRELIEGAEIVSGLNENDIILTDTTVKKGRAVQITNGTDKNGN